MIDNLKKAVSIFFFLAGLALLAGLGYWQVQRGEWKSGVLSQMEREYARDASANQLSAIDFIPPEEGEYYLQRGVVKGRFLEGKTTYWPKMRGGFYGFYLYDPFRLPSGEIVLVNRGWVQEDLKLKLPARNIPPPPEEREVALTGKITTKHFTSMTLDNDPLNNRWHRYDPRVLARHLQLENLGPTVFVVEEPLNISSYHFGELERTEKFPHNRHKLYALFWFAMASLWALIFGMKLFAPKYN